jgi:Flp pilus assembly protein TadG
VQLLRKLWENQAGNTAVIFGLAVIPLIALGGGIVDFAHRAKVRGELQSAADTAAIAAARVLQLGDLSRNSDEEALHADAVSAATDILNAALANLGGAEGANVDVEINGQTIEVSTNYAVDTSFLGVIGIQNLNAEAMAQVNLPDPILVEIAMVLDYSGSMKDAGKYARMTAAARNFIRKVERDRASTSQIGIVPFSEYVYAPMSTSDIRDDGAGYHDQGDDGGGWGGGSADMVTRCLLNRDYPYSASDETPSSGLPESQWPEGDETECENYATANLRVRDLTDDFDGLDNALQSMEPVGLTNISLATEMGWHILTPARPFETARDFSDDNVEKIIILLTDGMQTVPAMGPSGDISTEAADETTTELCRNAKDTDIRIFTIAYDVDDPAVEDLLLGCASSAATYFDARVADINTVFEEIYAQIQESVWLSR